MGTLIKKLIEVVVELVLAILAKNGCKSCGE